MRYLMCYAPGLNPFPVPVDRHTQAIYDLLANGTNKRVTLTKAETGQDYSYELLR